MIELATWVFEKRTFVAWGKGFPALTFLLRSSSAQYFVVIAFVCIKCVSPNNVVLAVVYPAVNLC